MKINIIGLSLLVSIGLYPAAPAFAQIIPVTDDGQLPGFGYQNVKVYAIAMTPNAGPKIIWMRGMPDWSYHIYQSQLDSTGEGWVNRFVTSEGWYWASIWTGPDGRAFIRLMASLLVEQDTGYSEIQSYSYLGMDSLGILHGFDEIGSDIYYCMSQDTALSRDQLIRLPYGWQVLGLRMSPDKGRYSLATLAEDTIYHYSGLAGQPIDTSTIAITLYGLSTPEWAIDNAGRLYTLVTLPNGENTTEVYGWTAEYGLQEITSIENYDWGETSFELAFCPSRNAVLALISDIRSAQPESTSIYYSLDRGEFWHTSSVRLLGGNASCPVLIEDTLYMVNEYPEQSRINFIKIPIDSIIGSVVSVSDLDSRPSTFELSIYPNPFNGETMISFSAPTGSNAIIEVFDIGGRLIRTLPDELVNPGPKCVKWDVRNNYGEKSSSGIYVARLKAGPESVTRKMLLLK